MIFHQPIHLYSMCSKQISSTNISEGNGTTSSSNSLLHTASKLISSTNISEGNVTTSISSCVLLVVLSKLNERRESILIVIVLVYNILIIYYYNSIFDLTYIMLIILGTASFFSFFFDYSY